MRWFSNRRVSARAEHTMPFSDAYQCFAAKTGGRVPQEPVLDPVLLSIFTSRKEINPNKTFRWHQIQRKLNK